MFCTNCGCELDGLGNFCTRCGMQLVHQTNGQETYSSSQIPAWTCNFCKVNNAAFVKYCSCGKTFEASEQKHLEDMRRLIRMQRSDEKHKKSSSDAISKGIGVVSPSMSQAAKIAAARDANRNNMAQNNTGEQHYEQYRGNRNNY